MAEESQSSSTSGIDVDAILQKLSEIAAEHSLNILAAIAILIIGRLVVKFMTGGVRKVMDSRNMDASLVGFATSLTNVLLMAVVIIAALNKVGIQTTSIVAIIGAAGLAIGLALQGSLSNFAAGVLILIFKPYRVQDFVSAGGATGIVEEIGIFTTTLLTPDNKVQIVPNSVATSGVIENFTMKGTRRLDLVVGVSYDDDLKKVKKILNEIIASESRVLPEPEPVVAVLEMADSSVNFAFRPWVNVPDYWDLYFHFQETIKLRFDEEGISIPFPQRDVHLIKSE